MKSILDIVTEGFFNPLASPNKRVYEIVIFELFELTIELKEENNRKLIEEKLVDFLNERPNIRFVDDDTNEELVDNKARVTMMMNNLIKNRWIFEESLGNNNYAINFYDYAHKIINVMKEIKEDRPAEYDRHLQTIMLYINQHKAGNFEDIRAIESNARQLLEMLRSLNSNIQRFYNNLIENKDKDELSLIVQTFLSYKHDYFETTYYKYKIEESSKRRLRTIKESLYEMKEDYYHLYIEHITNKDKLDLEEATNVLNKTFDDTLDYINEINFLDKSIDDKNIKYSTVTISKIYYLINRSANIKGLLNNMIDLTINAEQDNYDYINLFNVAHYNYEKLSKPRESKKEIEVELDIEIKELSLEFINKQGQIYFDSLKYTFENINQLVLKMLGSKDEIKAEEIELVTNDDYLKFMLIIMNSTIEDSLYSIELLDNKVTHNDYEFKDFIIRRKNND